jgi:hypothetical protein
MNDLEIIPTDQQLEAMDRNQFKAYENRLRAAADRQGLRLMKSRLRDRRALGYGTYGLVDKRTGSARFHATADGYGLPIGHIHRILIRREGML